MRLHETQVDVDGVHINMIWTGGMGLDIIDTIIVNPLIIITG